MALAVASCFALFAFLSLSSGETAHAVVCFPNSCITPNPEREFEERLKLEEECRSGRGNYTCPESEHPEPSGPSAPQKHREEYTVTKRIYGYRFVRGTTRAWLVGDFTNCSPGSLYTIKAFATPSWSSDTLARLPGSASHIRLQTPEPGSLLPGLRISTSADTFGKPIGEQVPGLVKVVGLHRLKKHHFAVAAIPQGACTTIGAPNSKWEAWATDIPVEVIYLARKRVVVAVHSKRKVRYV
jgi:hypothetical protein